jgi:adsorption protein B
MGSLSLISEVVSAIHTELLIFAGVFFLIGALDDIALDLYWLWLKFTDRAKTRVIDGEKWARAPLESSAAVFIPAWQEAAVITDTIAHTLSAWPQSDMRLYVGIYRNDTATLEAAIAGARGDARVRLVIHDRKGPTTKADCLNRLFLALKDDERRYSQRARMVVFQDAEDMVDPAGLALMDEAMETADFVQIPVVPLPQRGSRWLGSHYCDEFAEAHGKEMVVRGALGAALPSAGVGCAIARDMLDALAMRRVDRLPFAADSLTEDYEMGMGLAAYGARWTFLRARHANGDLVATRAFFPSRLEVVVKQKTRWLHGIALQGWDRIGWPSRKSARFNLAEVWMRARDRRGPLSAVVLFAGYSVFALTALGLGAHYMGWGEALELTPFAKVLLIANACAFAWRALMRSAFVMREHGFAEGLQAIMRIPLANAIAIMAGRRALSAYIRTLAGAAPQWEKTPHDTHPVQLAEKVSAR